MKADSRNWKDWYNLLTGNISKDRETLDTLLDQNIIEYEIDEDRKMINAVFPDNSSLRVDYDGDQITSYGITGTDSVIFYDKLDVASKEDRPEDPLVDQDPWKDWETMLTGEIEEDKNTLSNLTGKKPIEVSMGDYEGLLFEYDDLSALLTIFKEDNLVYGINDSRGFRTS